MQETKYFCNLPYKPCWLLFIAAQAQPTAQSW